MKHILIILFIAIGINLGALTMQEWMDAGGAKKDPYGTKCMDYCNDNLYKCRQSVDSTYSSRDRYVDGLRACNEAYNRCLETCIKACK